MHGRRLKAAAGCAAATFALLSITGCGQDQGGQESKDTSSSGSASAPNAATGCAAIWKDGGHLARSYDGCDSDAGFVTADTLGCSSGQTLVRYGDHFYAALGGTIHETESPLDDDRGYRGAVASCRA